MFLILTDSDGVKFAINSKIINTIYVDDSGKTCINIKNCDITLSGPSFDELVSMVNNAKA